MQMNSEMNVHQPFDAFTPRAWEPETSEQSWEHPEPHREISVHQLDMISTSFRMSTLVPLWTLREAIGHHRGLHQRQDHWNNFNIYQVQPQPSMAANPLDLHFLLEMPNDRLPSESLILVEKKEIRPRFNSQIAVWRVRNAMARNEIVHEVGAEHECGHNLDKCLVFVLGELWHPQHQDIRMVPNGALVKILYSLDEDEECSSSGRDSTNSRRSSRIPSVSKPTSSASSATSDESHSLMQTSSVQSHMERSLEDHVFRLLDGRRRLLQIPEDRAFGVHLWALARTSSITPKIFRAWLEPSSPSWERQCTDVLAFEFAALREGTGRWSFVLASPNPPALAYGRQTPNLLCIDSDVGSEARALLVDVFLPTWIRRVAMTFRLSDTVLTVATRLLGIEPQQLDESIFQIVWPTGDGDIVLHDHDYIALPSGAYVELSRHPRGTSEDCTLIQTRIQRTPSMTSDLAFGPYGQLDRRVSFHLDKEGQTPATDLSPTFLWRPIRTIERLLGEHQSQFLTRRTLLRLSFVLHPTVGLRPPGNTVKPDKMEFTTSFFDTLDVDDINEGVPVVSQFDNVTTDLHETVRKVATPMRSRPPTCEDTARQVEHQGPELFNIADSDEEEEELTITSHEPRHDEPQQMSLDTRTEDEIFDEILFYDPEIHGLHQDLAGLELHPSTENWLKEHPCIPFEDFDPFNFKQLQIHTDGSYNGSSSAWCFVLTAIDEHDLTHFVGFAADKVVLDAKHQNFAGTTRHGATQSELEALHWSSWWVARFVIAHGWKGILCFKWDSQTAGSKAQGLACNTPSSVHGPTASRVRSFQHLLSQWLGWSGLRHEHTKAHCGEPLNEMADVISKAANMKDSTWKTALPAPCQIETLAPLAFELLWYHASPDSWKGDVQRQLPPMNDGVVQWQIFPHQATDDQAKLEEWASMISPFAKSQVTCQVEKHFSLHFASYNVLSLGDQAEKRFSLHDEPGRVALLRQQAHDKGILIMGLQEARTPKGTFNSKTHTRFSSGAHEAGYGGVELWVSKLHPFARTTCGKLCFFTQSNFHVQIAEPTMLLVITENCGLDLLLAVLHAPHTGHVEEVQQEWWTHALGLLQRYGHARQIVLLMDANAKIGNFVDNSFGGHTIDQENANGDRLRQLANSLDLCAPASFAQLHWGKLETWTHPGTGKVSRLDYILCPRSWLYGEVHSWVDEECSSGHAIPDHSCICLTVAWSEISSHQERHRVPFDLRQIVDKRNAPAIAAILQKVPSYDWDMDANEHAHHLIGWLHGELSRQFPKRSTKKATPAFATDETTTTHALVVSANRQCRAAQRMRRDLILRKVFMLWKGDPLPSNLRQWLHLLNLKICRFKFEMGLHSQHLRTSLRADRRAFVQQIAEDAHEAAPGEIFKKLRPVLAPSKRHQLGPRALPRLRKQDGSYTTSNQEVNEMWVNHFAQLEAGTAMTPLTFFQMAIKEQPLMIKPSTWAHDELPQLQWIERAIRKLQNGKTPGPDMLPNELLKASPEAAARMLLPLMWKMVLRLQEPVLLKGGKMIPIPKRKGDSDSCDSHRGILLMSGIGKVLRSAGRPLIAKPFVESSDHMQLGGKPGIPVQFGCQAVRAFQDIARAKKMSCSLIFADVQAAYYKALRELAVGSNDQVTATQLTRRFHLDEATARTLHEALSHHGGQAALGGSPLQVALMASALSSTWFTCSGQEVIATSRGTRPGDSWADVSFSVIMDSILRKIKMRLDEAGLLVRFPQFGSTSPDDALPLQNSLPIYQTCWADDLALLVLSKTAEELPTRTASASQIMVRTIREHGMDIAVGEAKTAIVMTPRGPGAISIKRKFFGTPNAVLPILEEDQSFMIPLVPQYKHLGGQVNAKAGLLCELQHRAKRAKSMFWRAARTVFRSRHLPLQTRKRLFAACVMSTWFWGCGSWPMLNATETRFFISTTWQLWSLLLPGKPPDADFWTHSAIQLALDVPSPQSYLHEARLRHLGLLVKTGPSELWTLVLTSPAMRQSLQMSLQWFRDALGNDCELGPATPWEAWESLMCSNPARWKRLVSIASSRHQKHEMRLHQATHFYRVLSQELTTEGLFNFPGTMEQLDNKTSHLCLLCDKHFKNKRAWFLHAYVTHGYVSPHGRAAKGTVCFVCSKRYPNEVALSNHLRYSQRCCTAFALRDSLENRPLPVPETQHPQCPWRYVQHTDIMTDGIEIVDFETEALCTQLNAVWNDFDIVGDFEESALALAKRLIEALHCVLPFFKIKVSFAAWISSIRPLSYVLSLAVPHVDEWFDRRCAVPGEALDEKVLSSEDGRKRCQVRAAPPSPWSYMPVEVFFLHFFSGRRRTTDLQSALERISLPPGHQMWILSLDLQVCEKRCNLLLPDQQQLWIRLIRARRVCGTAAGPPCETWSIARWTPLLVAAPSRKRPPRPVRSRVEPWGLLQVSSAEHGQVNVGSLLLQFALLVTLIQALCGGFAVLEHPQDPATFSDELKAKQNGSIWSLAAMEWLLATGRMVCVNAAQGHFGGYSRKPTTLLVANVDKQLLQSLELHLRTTDAPLEQSIGVGGDGEWRTKRLKEYPEAFCSLLSHFFGAWLLSVSSLPPVDNQGEQDWLKDLHRTLDECPLQEQIGPDFRRDLAT